MEMLNMSKKKLEISSSEIARQFCIDNNIELPKGSEEALEYGKNFENVISSALHFSYKYGYTGNLKEYIKSHKHILIKGMQEMMDFNNIVIDTEIKLDDYDAKYDYLDSLTFKQIEAMAGEKLLDYFIKGIKINDTFEKQ
ncbi:MAG: hypothetical protein KatS3mg096_656 [Candidatus Parcubacteria bacterium]|nr:MAG: hypothetical protein KatS3mg096_656 [Candidatus Parcubacteria bacterium]